MKQETRHLTLWGQKKTLAAPDTTLPTPGNAGSITSSDVDVTSVTLSWIKATDNISSQANIQYQVYYSPLNDVDTVANMEANGVAFGGYVADIDTMVVTGLTQGTTYYFNIVAKDEAGNKVAYTMVTETTLASADVTSPVAGNTGILVLSNLTSTSVTVNWTRGTDDVTAQANLKYRVYYSSNNLQSLPSLDSKGTAVGDYEIDIDSKTVTGLSPDTKYYFNVVIYDEIW